MIPTTLLPILAMGAGAAAAFAAAMASARLAMPLAVLAAAFAFALFLAAAPDVAGGVPIEAPFWAVPSLGVSGGLALDGLSLLFTLLITGIGTLVFAYAGAYLKGDGRLNRFAALMLLFMTAMLGAVTADDVVTLFVFWELTSIASFFLVGFDHDKPSARKSALQALLVTGGGGLALLAGLVLVSIAAGTTSLGGILADPERVLAHPASGAALLLIVLGCFTKSAQVPFHFWLPNAMAAPTPVSAYLHSATMVKLGVYLLARLNPVYQEEPVWQGLLTWFGLATALTGALLALRETDLKRVLAYTTVTALGTAVLLIGIGSTLSVTAGVVFLVVHALYKAALFLVAGIVDHETGTRDASTLGGLARAMPVTAVAATLAALSMAGLPPFVGFVAKELAYEAQIGSDSAFHAVLVGGFLVNAAMVAVAGLLSFRLFFGRSRPAPRKPHDPGPAMLAGPLILAALGLVAGAAPGLLGRLLVDPAASAIAGAPVESRLGLWHGFTPLLALSGATILLGAGLYLAWERLLPTLRSVNALDRLGPGAAYERLLAGLISGSDRVTRKIQHGSLRGYLRMLFLAVSVGVTGTLVLRGGLDVPSSASGPPDPRSFAFLVLIVGAAAAALSPSLVASVMSVGLVGFATAVIFLLNGAPDLAFTQFAVEILFVLILASILVRVPIRTTDGRTRKARLIDLGVASATGLTVTLVLLAVAASPFDTRLSDWFGNNAMSEAHGRNVVNVILVDFRALDTLGEITVLAIAGLAVLALLRTLRTGDRP